MRISLYNWHRAVLQATERAGEIMDINKLIYSLEETISFLQNSQLSGWANMSIEEIIQELDSEIAKAKNSRPIETKRLSFLFAPKGAIEEISIDNSWEDD